MITKNVMTLRQKTKVLITFRSIQMVIIFDFQQFKFNDQNFSQNMKESLHLESNDYKALINAFGMYEQMSTNRYFD
jgi:hypothetical protein